MGAHAYDHAISPYTSFRFRHEVVTLHREQPGPIPAPPTMRMSFGTNVPVYVENPPKKQSATGLR
jgi:hypothetical protein